MCMQRERHQRSDEEVMSFTPISAFGLIFAAVFMIIGYKMPKPKPEGISDFILIGLGLVAYWFTFAHVGAYPAAIAVHTVTLGVIFVVVAVASPLLGLLENRLTSPRVAYSPQRTAGHVTTNVLGAALAAASVALCRRFPGSDSDGARFTNDEILNVFLALSTIVVLFFVHFQQTASQTTRHNKAEVSDAPHQSFYENSLSRWHQSVNVLFLITMTFVAITSFVYVLAVSMLASRNGEPLEFTWEAALVISSAILFVLACGLPQSRANASVFLTFLTGTPAILIASVLWVGFFQDSFVRNLFALVSTTTAYTCYVALVIWDLRDRGEKTEPHFFAALTFALLLAALLAALYFSK